MKGVILDADSLGPGDVDLGPVTQTLDDWAVYPFTEPGDIAARIRDAHVVLSNKIPLDRAHIAGANQLQFISVMATGTNNIDLDAARERGIVVSNAVAYATPSVVQHTLSMMLALSNNLVSYVADVRAGRWQQSNVFCLLDHPITELAGKSLGIVGYGELGSNVAKVASAFGMDILVSARPGTAPTEGRIGFEQVLSQADYVSLHCPLTEQTQGIINQRTLALMKPRAFLINTARGGLVDSSDLVEALQTGVIAGAAIDVLDSEPPTGADEPLLQADLPNLIVTPHCAWGAREARARLVTQMRENIDAFLDSTPVRKVN